MILVKNIEVIKTDRDETEIMHCENPLQEIPLNDDFDAISPMEFHKEYIGSRRFVNHRGEDVRLGYSKLAEDVIGFPFDVLGKELDDARKQIKDLYWEAQSYKGHLDNFRNMSFWQRLKFLFKNRP